MDFSKKSVLVTGGTGTVGKNFVKYLLKNNPKRVVVVSRNELNQVNLRRELVLEMGESILSKVTFAVCDIRNNEIFKRLFEGIDIVVHTAALKHIDVCEVNIQETIEINALGTMNVVNNAVDYGVEKAVLLSTDKVCAPNTVYGASKLMAERIFLDAKKYNKTKFAILRCGNIAGSNGSVIPVFRNLLAKGQKVLPVTTSESCRFWLEVKDVIVSLCFVLENMGGGEVFIPKMPSFKIVDLAKAMSNNDEVEYFGLRKNEKESEGIFNEGRNIFESDTMFVELNEKIDYSKFNPSFKKVENPVYTTKENDKWLSINDLKQRIKNPEA
ncbi:MAG: SDR family NAD(P)-dependent oxidoreductase [Clostridia bacterium]|nr:SDR family NAD(P)-dependent oxidoreductase [Clostridia bacterium]